MAVPTARPRAPVFVPTLKSWLQIFESIDSLRKSQAANMDEQKAKMDEQAAKIDSLEKELQKTNALRLECVSGSLRWETGEYEPITRKFYPAFVAKPKMCYGLTGHGQGPEDIWMWLSFFNETHVSFHISANGGGQIQARWMACGNLVPDAFRGQPWQFGS